MKCPKCGWELSDSYGRILHCGNCNVYIPSGPYCYTTVRREDGRLILNTCSHYALPNRCKLLDVVDDVLLIDQCKICGTF